MADHEKEELLRQIEKGLEHSRKIIAQINEALAQRQASLRALRLAASAF